MRYSYLIFVKFKTGDLFSSYRKVEDDINSYMKEFGFAEKMVLQSESPLFNLTVGELLSPEQQQQVLTTLNSQLVAHGKNMECTRMQYAGIVEQEENAR